MSLFEELFGNQQRHRNFNQQVHAFGRHNDRHDNHRARYDEHNSPYFHGRDRDDFSHVGSIARTLVNNKTLLVLVGLVLVVVLALFVAALTFVVPQVPKLLGYLDSNGLNSLLDQGLAIIGKVLAIGGR